MNDALKAPDFWPQYHIFADVGIWRRYKDMKLHRRTMVLCQPRARKLYLQYDGCSFKDRIFHYNHQARCMTDGTRPKSCCDPKNDDLYVSRTVATAGIMAAYKMGARRIFLLGVDGYKLPGPDGGIYYFDGRGKGKERRKEKHPKVETRGGKAELRDDLLEQDRHEWWRRNMKELRQWFDVLGVYQDPYRYRDETGQVVAGSNVFNLSGLSTVGTWQKVKVRTVLGPGCFARSK